MRDFHSLLLEYSEKFNECFPTHVVRNFDEAEQIALVQKCLDTGKKYKFKYEDGVDY